MALRQLASRAARAVTTGVPSLAIKDQLAPACLRAGAARFYSSEGARWIAANDWPSQCAG